MDSLLGRSFILVLDEGESFRSSVVAASQVKVRHNTSLLHHLLELGIADLPVQIAHVHCGFLIPLEQGATATQRD
jgi:hypothetical protein